MDNKLSELSKPVAYMTAEGVAITHLDFESGSWGMHNAAKSDDMWFPLYSQEYVSALKHESAVNWEAAASLNVENQELKKRIAELEDAEQKLCAANVTLDARASEAEAKLATPKPPEKCPTCNRRYTLESYAHGECAICGDPFDANDALRSMGFTVEGDE